MRTIKVTILDLSIAKVFVSLIGIPSTVKGLHLSLNIQTEVYIIMLFSFIGFFIILAFITYKKIDLLNFELDTWSQNVDANLYVQFDGKVGYLNNIKIKYKKWLRKNLFIPNLPSRKEMFFRLVENNKSLDGNSLIHLGLKESGKKHWFGKRN